MVKTPQALRSILGRATITRVDDASELQTLQVSLSGEVLDDVPRVQNYGFTSVPMPGSKAALIMNGGRRDSAVAVACDDPSHRPHLKDGEVAVYTHEGEALTVRQGRAIELTGNMIAIKRPGGDELIGLLLELIDEIARGKIGNAPVTYTALIPLVRPKFEAFKTGTTPHV